MAELEHQAPADGGYFLPTRPATRLEFVTGHRWASCRRCVLLGGLHLWTVRGRHQTRRHPDPMAGVPKIGDTRDAR